MASETATATTTSAIPESPSPWECKGSAWWFPIYSLSKNIYPGSCYPTDFDAGVNDGFQGGLGMIQVVRYSSTPVGPYDEIVYIPGYFSTPHASSSRYRITNIYVSSRLSVYNGRKNWNIPKHLAVFKFDTSETTGTTTIQVAHPEDPENPFFVAVVKDIPVISKLPMPLSTTYFPMNLEFHQPRLNAVDTAQGKENGETGTEDWMAVKPWQSGKVKFVTCELKNGNGDGKWPDKIDGVWSLGIKWEEGMTLRFPVAKELKGKL